MPHECTSCGRIFPDGSTEMLSGCPECGGTTFQYHPEMPADASEPPDEPEPESLPPENTAQAEARSTVVDKTTLPDPPETPASTVDNDHANDPTPSEEPTPTDSQPADQSDLTELRSELNEQFESIKIVSPGEYELNLMELYDREEYIVSLLEDGRYAIDVPDRWTDGE